MLRVLGPCNSRKKEIEDRFGVVLHARNDCVTLEGRSKSKLKAAGDYLLGRIALPDPEPDSGVPVSSRFPDDGGNGAAGRLVTTGRCGPIHARTPGQARFVEAVTDNDLTFVIGPAGTGKTYLAVAMAVEALKTKSVERIVLVRPAVEAGESLGFLPGNLREKVDPYLAPLYDALHDILPRDGVARYFEDRVLEVSPLAYMRGRTLNGAFIILDEAQNATLRQLKMFLTRLGRGSRAVVAGDITQIDLAEGKSGLLSMKRILRDVPGIAFVEFGSGDVLRHRLVRTIIDAYEDFERNHGA